MFSGAVTCSPVKRRLRSDFFHSPDQSVLSPDSSYLLNSPDSAPCWCRRSPRLLTNGYYNLSQGSFSVDQSGHVSLQEAPPRVSYRESSVRVFRRRRRSLVSLLHDVKDNCQSWLFTGVFRTQSSDPGPGPGPDLDLSPETTHRPSWDLDLDCSRDQDPLWTRLNSTELDERLDFVYDPTEVPPPLDKQPLIQEEPAPDTCQSQETFGQSVGGLSEVPPTVFSQSCCCQSSEQRGLTGRGLLLFIFTVFIMAALLSR
ncbi:unnamed protein product [Knipowitschia caucasica]